MSWPILVDLETAIASGVTTMNPGTIRAPQGARYELRFRSLFRPGRGYSFPCDAAGHVDLDALGEGERNSYFLARTTVGHDFAMPVVQRGDLR
jgi:hypothetical protein